MFSFNMIITIMMIIGILINLVHFRRTFICCWWFFSESILPNKNRKVFSSDFDREKISVNQNIDHIERILKQKKSNAFIICYYYSDCSHSYWTYNFFFNLKNGGNFGFLKTFVFASSKPCCLFALLVKKEGRQARKKLKHYSARSREREKND